LLVLKISDPDEEKQITQQLQRGVLKRGANKFDELDDTDSRVLALDWLLYKDKMKLQSTSSNLGQRYILALLAFEFGYTFRPNVNWLSSMTECKWDWVTCNGELKVTELELGAHILFARVLELVCALNISNFLSFLRS
jgi:hypothetical protein